MLDLQKYFPPSGSVLLNKAGAPHSRYTFTLGHPGFKGLYDTFLKPVSPGRHYVWRKEYWTNGAWVTATYAILHMGDDGSVLEVGDWLHLGGGQYGVFGYRNDDGSNAGLVWCPPGGLSTEPQYNEMATISQAYSGAAFVQNGSRCYSESGLIDTDNGLCHMVMYHGVRNAGSTPVKAKRLPLVANGVYYRNRSEWDEYAMELWLSFGVGVVRERTPFIENAAWWGLPDFVGELFGAPGSWTTEIA